MQDKRALGYVQTSSAITLDQQMADLNKHAIDSNFTIVGWVLGTEQDKSGLKNLLSGRDARIKEVDIIATCSADSIADNANDFFYYLCEFKKLGKIIDYISLGVLSIEQVKTLEELIEYIFKKDLLGRRRLNSNVTRGNCTSANGKAGPTTYGYNRGMGGLIVDEEESEVIKTIFSQRSDGFTLREIVRGLKNKGIKTRNDNYFATGTIAKIINNKKLYEGYILNKLGEWVKGNHPAILEEV